jgi:hypothetical protein
MTSWRRSRLALKKAEKDFAAGDLGGGTLTLIVVAIAAVLIIVLITKL